MLVEGSGTARNLRGSPKELCGNRMEHWRNSCGTAWNLKRTMEERKRPEKEIPGRYGGKLKPMRKGDLPPENAGRKKNLFKEYVRQVAEQGEVWMEVRGQVVKEDGTLGEFVTIRAKFPAVEAVVRKMFKRASKGSVSAARWVSETGYGKPTTFVGEDEENPLGGGFAVVLPDNLR